MVTPAAAEMTPPDHSDAADAATLPAYRRRGVQSALLLRRLAEASDNHCTVAIVTTQPGSKSQENVQRQGFELLYSRNVLRREAR